jgi:aquaporin Z
MATELRLENYLAEFIGTFFLVFTVGLNVLQNTALAPVSIGAILLVMVFAGGSVSGAHYNPAVTLGVFLSQNKSQRTDGGLVSAVDAVVYVFVQCLAGCLGAAMYYWVLGATFTLKPGHGFDAFQAGFAELLFTAALVFVVLNCALTKQDELNQYYGLAIGFTLMSAAFAIGPVSGCCLNPALAVGVVGSHYFATGSGAEFLALYLIVPLVAGGIASLVFRVVRRAEYSNLSALPQ